MIQWMRLTDLSSANPADVGVAAAVAAGDGHVVPLRRARDPLHAPARPRTEIGYRSVDVVQLRRTYIRVRHRRSKARQ